MTFHKRFLLRPTADTFLARRDQLCLQSSLEKNGLPHDPSDADHAVNEQNRSHIEITLNDTGNFVDGERRGGFRDKGTDRVYEMCFNRACHHYGGRLVCVCRQLESMGSKSFLVFLLS